MQRSFTFVVGYVDLNRKQSARYQAIMSTVVGLFNLSEMIEQLSGSTRAVRSCGIVKRCVAFNITNVYVLHLKMCEVNYQT